MNYYDTQKERTVHTHNIGSYKELENRLAIVSERRDAAHAEIKQIENRAVELSLVMKPPILTVN